MKKEILLKKDKNVLTITVDYIALTISFFKSEYTSNIFSRNFKTKEDLEKALSIYINNRKKDGYS